MRFLNWFFIYSILSIAFVIVTALVIQKTKSVVGCILLSIAANVGNVCIFILMSANSQTINSMIMKLFH